MGMYVKTVQDLTSIFVHGKVYIVLFQNSFVTKVNEVEMQNKEELIRELMDAMRSIRKRQHHETPPMPIRKSEMYALMQIGTLLEDSPEGIRVGDLGTHLKLAAPTVSSIVNVLEERGFTERIGSKLDRRVVYITLTEKGRDFLAGQENHFKRHIVGLVEYLGEEDTKAMIRLVKRSVQYFESQMKRIEEENND